MSRRAFIKQVVASGIYACLPVTVIRQGVSMETLQRCCRYEDQRYDMTVPFVEDSHVSATDGRIGVQVFDGISIADFGKPLRRPPLADALDQLWSPDSRWRDWPNANYTNSIDDIGGCCWACNSHGYLGPLSKCKNCDGIGSIPLPINAPADEWGESYETDCLACCDGWKSDQQCPVCNGNPHERTRDAIQEIDDIKIASKYHHTISMLPGVRYSVSKLKRPGQKLSPVLFQFEGGRGAVMPIKA